MSFCPYSNRPCPHRMYRGRQRRNSKSLCPMFRKQCQRNMIERIQEYMDTTDETWNYITPPQLYKSLTQPVADEPDLFLLDIRRPKDYHKRHIPKSFNIFWKQLFETNNLAKLPCPIHQPNTVIVLICYVGHTSSQTLTLLKLLGYHVISVKFGMGISPDPNVPIKGWIDYGYPTVTSKSTSS